MSSAFRMLADLRLWTGAAFAAFQYWILQNPQAPLVERPVHLIFALLLVLLWNPLSTRHLGKAACRAIDAALLAATLSVGAYIWLSLDRLETRIDNVSPVFDHDVVFGTLLVVLLLEAVRRTVGWILVGVILAFLAYGAWGYLLPGAAYFRGFAPREYIEILTMTTSGILGITTETSVNFVFYFVAFGVAYAAVGGGQLFIDLAMRLVGTAHGGSAKVAIVGSSLMGTISGSAVANVTATGVFTIPLMRRSGIAAERAGAYEAIASTGGQLMPPVMGVAAFVMAELLSRPYIEIALAGLVPALAFYVALFIYADLHARKSGTGTVDAAELKGLPPVGPRLHLLLPPIVLVAALVAGYSAQIAATIATVSCLAAAFLRRASRPGLRDLARMVLGIGRQAAEVAAPIAAIGIIIAVAIQSNMALKFSAGVISAGGGTLAGSLILIILGCIVMGMGLPTVAAYIIGAILYVPALQNLGVGTLAAHFFVMYYCVLSMVTPPVALASFAAAGLAQTSAIRTSVIAFRMCLVAFLIPFAFIVDDALLFQDGMGMVLIASAGLLASTSVWAIGLIGYFVRPLAAGDRLFLLACGITAIVSPTGDLLWAIGVAAALGFLALNWRFPRFTTGTLVTPWLAAARGRLSNARAR